MITNEVFIQIIPLYINIHSNMFKEIQSFAIPWEYLLGDAILLCFSKYKASLGWEEEWMTDYLEF